MGAFQIDSYHLLLLSYIYTFTYTFTYNTAGCAALRAVTVAALDSGVLSHRQALKHTTLGGSAFWAPEGAAQAHLSPLLVDRAHDQRLPHPFHRSLHM